MIPLWFSVVMVLIVTIAVFVGMWLERRITKEGTPSTSTNSQSTPLCIICGKAHCQHLCPYWPKSGNEV